jgi:dephospho-CoA kinase
MVIFYLNFKDKMHIIGLTGGIGSGKSEAAKIFSSFGAKIIDLDIIAHDLTTKNALGYSLIIEHFGDDFLNNKKEIDRKKLRKSIFEDKKIKKDIESILHPLIMEECQSQIKILDNALYLILVVPLLFENATYLKLKHESLLIDCSEKTQLERVTNRDGADPKLTKLIIKSQADRNLRIKKADKIILNEGSLEDLSNNIQLFHKDIITKIDNLL